MHIIKKCPGALALSQQAVELPDVLLRLLQHRALELVYIVALREGLPEVQGFCGVDATVVPRCQ